MDRATKSRRSPRRYQKIKNPETALEVRHEAPKDESTGQNWPLGWYVFVRKHSKYYRAILVQFARKIDAQIAERGLREAGLITLSRLKAVHPMEVMRAMTENLQW